MREDATRRARRLDRAVAVALATFNELPGALSTMQPADRALRLRALDAAIEALGQAEERRRLLRTQAAPDRQAYLEFLARLRETSAARRGEAPADALTGLLPGDSARVVVRIDHASPQALACLSTLVRSLPEGTVTVERAAPGWTAATRHGRRRPLHLSPVPPTVPPAAG